MKYGLSQWLDGDISRNERSWWFVILMCANAVFAVGVFVLLGLI